MNERKHVHHSYIWLGGLRAAAVFIFALLVGGISGIVQMIKAMYELGYMSSEASGIIAIVLFIFVMLLIIGAIVFGIHAWAYRHLWYEVGTDEISVYSGIFSKKRVHVPYDRIQTVDQKASLLQRAFGVCNVVIDTAGGANNKAVIIPYLRKADADQLRHEVYARKMNALSAAGSHEGQTTGTFQQTTQGSQQTAQVIQDGNVLDAGAELWEQVGGVFAGDAFDMGAPSFEYRLSNKELIFTGLSNSGGLGVVVITLMAIVVQVFGFAFDLFPEQSDSIVTNITSMFDIQILIIIGSIAAVVATIIGWGLSVLGTCIQYGGFDARRRGTRIEVERGLLKHQTESLDVSRIQSVIIKQSFIRRLIGYCELSLGKVSAQEGGDSSGDQSQNISGLVVHPFIKTSRVQEILDGLVPEFADVPTPDIHVAKVALRRGLIRRCIWQGSAFWTTVTVAATQIALHVCIERFDPESISALPYIDVIAVVLYACAAVFLVFDIIGTVFWFRDSAFATNKRYIRIKNGGLSSLDVTVPRQKLQFGNTKSNPLQRLAGTSTIQMRTAAGVGGTTTQLIDIPRDAAISYLEWVMPRCPLK